jgi:hypothetical protein
MKLFSLSRLCHRATNPADTRSFLGASIPRAQTALERGEQADSQISDYAAALTSVGMTFAGIETTGGDSIGTGSTGRDTMGRGSLYLAGATVKSSVFALFVAFRVFLVFVFGAEDLGLFMGRGWFNLLPTLRAVTPLVPAVTILAPLPPSSPSSFNSSDSISCRRSFTFA